MIEILSHLNMGYRAMDDDRTTLCNKLCEDGYRELDGKKLEERLPIAAAKEQRWPQ